LCKQEDKKQADKEELRLLGIEKEVPLYYGKGCEHCSFTGYFGRTGIFELLVVDDDIRRLILKNADANQLRDKAREKGMRTLLEDGAEKIKAGITTLSEVLRVTQEA